MVTFMNVCCHTTSNLELCAFLLGFWGAGWVHENIFFIGLRVLRVDENILFSGFSSLGFCQRNMLLEVD
jgi:hypothetical protein